MGGKSFSRLILRQGYLSHNGDALSIHSIIILQDVGNSKLTRGLGGLTCFFDGINMCNFQLQKL